MAQDLYYTPTSSSLVLIKEGDNNNPYYWYDVSRLEISGSAYDATISGSDFGGTAASARIYAYSGSVLLVSFPLEDTNLYYPPFPNPISLESLYYAAPITQSYSTFYWNFDFEGVTPVSVSLYDSSSAISFLNEVTESNNGAFPIISGNTYILSISGGYFDYAELTITNITSGSIAAYVTGSVSSFISASFIPLEFNDYETTLYLTYSP
jgi:hypothetical protein